MLTIPEPVLSASLPVLLSTGAGALAWRRVARSPSLRATEAAEQLRSTARLQALDATLHDRAMDALAQLLNAEGVRPLLFKGRALMQYYAERRLRPMGDVDLCAPPGRFDELATLFRRNGFIQYASSDAPDRGRVLCLISPGEFAEIELFIDLHEHLERFFLPALEAVFIRACPMPLGKSSMLIPAPEDHLRLIVIHFLSHGGWRPLSLCDIAAMLEALPPDFDWELCLGPVRHRRHWLGVTFALAKELLDARMESLPADCRAPSVPGWLTRALLDAWAKPFSEHHARPILGDLWRHGLHRFLAGVMARWPNPIRATVELDSAINEAPRWPYQLAHFGRSSVRRIITALQSRGG